MSMFIQGPQDRVCHIAYPRESGVYVWTYCDRAYTPSSLRQRRHSRPNRVCKVCDKKAANR